MATAETNSNAIWLQNGASNNVIKYIPVLNNSQNTARTRSIVIGTSTTTGLVNNQLCAGYYNYNWNASEFTSGIYYYKLISDESFVVKKMMLLK